MPEIVNATSTSRRPPIIEKTTRTRVISDEEQEKEKLPIPKIWEYQENMQPGDWTEHIGYLYRVQPKIAGQESYLIKFTEPLTMDFVREKFGGQVFRAILKKGQQRVCDTLFTIEAPPKMQTENQNYMQQPPIQPAGDIARHAIDVATDPQRGAVALVQSAAQAGFDMLRAQAVAGGAQQLTMRDMLDLVDRMVAARTAAPPAGSGIPPWLEQTLAVAIPALLQGFVAKLLTPENPIETFGKLATALQSIPGMNPKGGGSDWKASIVEVLPSIAQQGTQMMHEWRLATEAAAGAQLRQLPSATMPINLAAPNPNAPPPAPGVPGAPPPADPPAVSGPPPPPPDNWLKLKFVEMFQAGRSAEEVGMFLDEIAPNFLDEIGKYQPTTLLPFMKKDAILGEVANDPKMLPFLSELHAWINAPEIEAAIATEAAQTQKPA